MKQTQPLLVRGDARALPLADESVDLIVTSPPYFGLRSYQDGGEHFAGQLGAEASPREFVDALVECTREMVRVLKPAGSIFVNLGDRFSNGDRYDNEFTVEDAAWLGGVVDSDGSVMIRKQGTSYTAVVCVGQMRREVIERIASVTATGNVGRDTRGVWNWTAAAQQAAWVLRRIWPWLHIKRNPALAAVELQGRKAAVGGKGRWNALTEEELRRRQLIRDAVMAWNHGQSFDYAPPLLPLPDLPMTARRIPQKSLSLLPERYRIAAVDELGLIARAVLVWSKPNGLPESVTDRVRRSHEDWVHLTKQPRYYAAIDEIREPPSGYARPNGTGREPRGGQKPRLMLDTTNPRGRVPGSVWEVPTQPLNVPKHVAVDHYAAFPMEWPRRLIQGWCPRDVCTACGEGRWPIVEREQVDAPGGSTAAVNRETASKTRTRHIRKMARGAVETTITGYACSCPDVTAATTPGVVLDPFGGTGTTALVASMLGRTGISVDLSADYCRLAQWRTSDPKERARAAGTDPAKAAEVDPLQPDLFGGAA